MIYIDSSRALAPEQSSNDHRLDFSSCVDAYSRLDDDSIEVVFSQRIENAKTIFVLPMHNRIVHF